MNAAPVLEATRRQSIDMDDCFGAESLFDSFPKCPDGLVAVQLLIDGIIDAGIELSDSRVQNTVSRIAKRVPSGYRSSRRMTSTAIRSSEKVDLAGFKEIVTGDLVFLDRIFHGDLIVQDWNAFADQIADIFLTTTPETGGHNASYIPQLSKVDPEHYAVSVCTVDGQRFSVGDFETPFCLQSCSKPINYCFAVDELGISEVLTHIGFEPSGQRFNKLTLNDQGLPHNPCLNAGGIMSCSLYKQGKSAAERFEFAIDQWKRLCGGGDVAFDNPTYLSEKATADRNFCLAYMMREEGAFPPDTDIIEALELYFMCCSITVNCADLAVAAATLANAGVCPTTQERVFLPSTVQSILSLMYSCGMYDYSGEWAFRMGLPAKSGVSGCIMGVIPDFGGIAVWSPRLDTIGNSQRGVAFFKELVSRFNFHHFDLHTSASSSQKKDPRQKSNSNYRQEIIELLYAASEGNLREIRRLTASGLDLDSSDYDGRTAMHLAAADGQAGVIEYLVRQNVNVVPVDRWGNTPHDDAVRGGYTTVAETLSRLGAV